VRGECSLPRAVTGRIQFRSPNLQGVEKGDVDGVKVRKLFRRKSVKTSLVRGDFQQFELTLLAQAAGSQKLINYLRDGGDFYLKIALDMFPESDKSKLASLREVAKKILFLIVYGGQAKTPSQVLGTTTEQAQVFLNLSHSAYPEIQQHEQSLRDEVRQVGYIRTMGGRRRYLPELESQNEHECHSAERKILSTFIQGTAADITKVAMVYLADQLPQVAKDADPKLVLQVHDELVIEVETNLIDAYAGVLRSVMEKASMAFGFAVSVRLTAGTSPG